MKEKKRQTIGSSYTKDFSKVYTKEIEYLKKRRETYDLPPVLIGSEETKNKASHPREGVESIDPNIKHGTVGLALSGGGIRSATFNLGVLQGLNRHDLVKYIDYLSTVSGGGYIGSCLSSLLDNKDAKVSKEEFPFRFERNKKDAGSGQYADERKEMKHLRRYGSYLAMSPSLFSIKVWRLIGSFFSGLVLTNLIPAGLLILLLKLISLIDKLDAIAQVSTALLMGSFFVLIIMVGLRFSTAFKDLQYKDRLKLGFAQGRLMFLAALLGAAGFLLLLNVKRPVIIGEGLILMKNIIGNKNLLSGSLLITIFGLLMGIVRTENSLLRKIRDLIFRIASVLVIPIVYILLLNVVKGSEFIEHTYSAYFISAAAILLGSLTNSNRISIHHIYRDRLSEAYIIKRRSVSDIDPSEISLSGDRLEDDEDLIASNEPLRLSQLHRYETAPYHLINATLNVPNSKNRYLRGRGAELFLFSKEYTGSMSTGYRQTTAYEDGKTRLATAMAVSGAAASPGMGSDTSRLLTLLLTLLNVRLNRWMPNPSRKKAGSEYFIWFWYFLKELLGMGKETDSLLNISDGGHHENLGVYPLLQRRCKVIIASDAGADPKFQMNDLAGLMRKARIDLGVNIDLNLNKLKPEEKDKAGFVSENIVCGEIGYPEGETGTFIYIKSSLTGKESQDILAYKRENPDFPDETTGDQFFDEAQFESYRELGYQIVSRFFKDAEDGKDTTPWDIWEQNLMKYTDKKIES